MSYSNDEAIDAVIAAMRRPNPISVPVINNPSTLPIREHKFKINTKVKVNGRIYIYNKQPFTGEDSAGEDITAVNKPGTIIKQLPIHHTDDIFYEIKFNDGQIGLEVFERYISLNETDKHISPPINDNSNNEAIDAVIAAMRRPNPISAPVVNNSPTPTINANQGKPKLSPSNTKSEKQRLHEEKVEADRQRKERERKQPIIPNPKQQTINIKYSDIFLKWADNSCYFNSPLHLILSMSDVCDLIMKHGNKENLLYNIISRANQTGAIVQTKDLKNEYIKCIAIGIDDITNRTRPIKWGETAPAESQLDKILEFNNIKTNDVKDLIYGYDGRQQSSYDEKEATTRKLPMMILNQQDIKMNSIEKLIKYAETGFERHYKLTTKQKYAIININRYNSSSFAGSEFKLTQINVSDYIMVDNKVMELKGFIHYDGKHYVFFAKNGDKWSLYDDLNDYIHSGLSQPKYNGENVLHLGMIYLYKLVDCAKVLQK